MREIVLDTETTGLDPAAGHRIVEVAGLELRNHLPTGQYFQRYINPERDMPAEAERVHGLSESFLRNHPIFSQIAKDLVEFLDDAALIIHNAAFDVGFLNAELQRARMPKLKTREVIDTVVLARKRFPGAQVNLDALCRRFNIDATARDFHGALLDCELLAQVYLELVGGRQPGLALSTRRQPSGKSDANRSVERKPREYENTTEELAAHAAMLDRMADPIWRR